MTPRGNSVVPEYDAFGEPVEAGETAPDERRVRVAAVTVFWALATLLTAGRVYTGDRPFAETLAAVPTQIAALITTVR